jgi:choline dehydrogenase
MFSMELQETALVESDHSHLKSEFVVVGGGSSGAVIAARLAEAGRDVILVEAGPDYGPFGSGLWPKDLLDAHTIALSHDWQYGSGRWTFERARVMGGCSAHNGAIAAVGHSSDYDSWNLPGWDTASLRPLLATALQKMRVRTYQPHEAGPFHARCLEAAAMCGWHMGQDLCVLDANASFGLESVNIVDRVRWNAAFAYLDPVRQRANLRIVDRTLVDHFVETADGVSIVGWRDGQKLMFDADRLVLAAGVYGSPAILQRSGIGDPQALKAAGVNTKHKLPGVGRNLHDHSMINADRDIGPDLQRWLDEAAATGNLPEEQTLGKAVSSQSADGIFDLHLFPVCASTQTSLTQGLALICVCCMTPQARGQIDIVSSDPTAMPRINHNYLGDAAGHDIAVLRDGLRMAEELFNAPPLASVLGKRRTTHPDDDAIRRQVIHYYHPVGTCPMGAGPDAVCDAKGSVHDLSRVTVGDVSLMPQIPRANTNIPAVMIGERIAGFLCA